jgi:tetratricopeptide (TPR) repeat protein
LPEKNSNDCLRIGKKILNHLGKKGTSGVVVNCGISAFPFSITTFRKSDLLLNCRKALCHAAFLTPGSLVVCDAVSFNISGDIYYGDGDLVLAVKEYRRGLFLEPNDGNLLNSLGVCYAQMNRHKLAVECFQRACQNKNDKFMALYNLGLEQQIMNENRYAINSFSEALKLTENDGEEKARLDMSFQLAILCIQEGLHKRALELLEPWHTVQQKTGTGEKGLRYLGEASYGIGKSRDAMKYLQQAMRYDEYDAEVLGLLGEIYLRENEGDDIGLRFCEKAVELSPDSPGLKIRLASAQIQCGDFQSALQSLQPCLRNKKIRPAALVQKGLLARELGKFKDAEKWLLKVEACPCSDSRAKVDAKNYLNDWKRIQE